MSARLTPRLWDSEFFGIRVAQIDGRELGEEPLAAALLEAKRGGFELVYWQSNAGTEVTPGLLHRFAGQLVDRRLTYQLALCDAIHDCSSAARELIVEHPIGPAANDLAELAIAAGEFSRFKVDRHLPCGRFEALYRTWIERSTRQEIADAVFTAQADGRILGMSTLSANPPSGKIGLISVRQEARGRGIGRGLLATAHRWMAKNGLRESSVTTQECNHAACALYERCGYQVVDRSRIYHFWPAK